MISIPYLFIKFGLTLLFASAPYCIWGARATALLDKLLKIEVFKGVLLLVPKVRMVFWFSKLEY
ncbi:hypothetical protein Hac_1152 [Helicobacter acinonychis str. Sheeba]|uniref:Uncharacterized protein n=1 Tax=Helicobacter acinonychis (strain Sheeba) TaxID=382638 RepID=Q17WR5_HELAH|nr:hypothetical protein Hac_1152 [Helicobacter acinonychis str. Sheeba]